MPEINDHPDIAAAMRTGYPRGKQIKARRCPVCGESASYRSELYVNSANEVIGCDECLRRVDAEEYFNDKLNESENLNEFI